MSTEHVLIVFVLMQPFICSCYDNLTTKAELHGDAEHAGCVCTDTANMSMAEQLGPKCLLSHDVHICFATHKQHARPAWEQSADVPVPMC